MTKVCEKLVFSALPGFVPLKCAWTGDAALFPSEQAARWALKMHRKQFIDAGVLVFWAGGWCIDIAKAPAVIKQIAVDSARRRAGIVVPR